MKGQGKGSSETGGHTSNTIAAILLDDSRWEYAKVIEVGMFAEDLPVALRGTLCGFYAVTIRMTRAGSYVLGELQTTRHVDRIELANDTETVVVEDLSDLYMWIMLAAEKSLDEITMA
jgi:hypothetical protein